MNLVFFGPPGAGKGTQSAYLIEALNLRHISSGDMFRANIKNRTPLGIEAQKFMDNGKLVPDELTIAMVKETLQGLRGQGFILDGFPRNLAQAEALDGMLSRIGLKIDKAVFFEVAEELLVSRLSGRWTCKNCGAVYHAVTQPPSKAGVCDKCGHSSLYQRPDDHSEAIKTRLKVYADQTAPLRQYYLSKGKLAAVDGSGEPGVVFERLKLVLGIGDRKIKKL